VYDLSCRWDRAWPVALPESFAGGLTNRQNGSCVYFDGHRVVRIGCVAISGHVHPWVTPDSCYNPGVSFRAGRRIISLGREQPPGRSISSTVNSDAQGDGYKREARVFPDNGKTRECRRCVP
jgi:hypothetical protein